MSFSFPSTLPAWLNYLRATCVSSKHVDFAKTAAWVKRLLPQLKNSQIVTIAGTNGKGSCASFLESLLLAAGVSAGVYRSPHLLHFNERISLNGEYVSDETLCTAFAWVETQRQGWPLTRFEFITLAALRIFAEAAPRVLVLEVGLGGRLDAVNWLDADVAVITTIDLDHTRLLGADRETIAGEKAGIFRTRRPVVCADSKPPRSLLAYAQELNAPFYQIMQDFKIHSTQAGWDWEGPQCGYRDLPEGGLANEIAAAAIMVLELLNIHASEKSIRQGLASVRLAGRWDDSWHPRCIFDVAHNPAASQWLAERAARHTGRGRYLAVFGILQDKDIMGVLKPMCTLIQTWYVGTLAHRRAVSGAKIKQALQKLTDRPCVVAENIEAALAQALADCSADDRIMVFGSFHTVAAGMQVLEAGKRKERLDSLNKETIRGS